MNNRITAVFDSEAHAAQAIDQLRTLGVADSQISVIRRQGDAATASGTGTASAAAQNAADTASDAGKGALAGAGVGALFGLAAAMIPGIGPFITAGALASALGAAGGGAVAGAIVGGTSGAIAAALANAGYNENEANYYGGEIERGGIFVAVDSDGAVTTDQVRGVLAQHGGRFASA